MYFIDDGICGDWDDGKPSPPNPYAVTDLNGYYSKIQFKIDKIFNYKTEY